MIQQLKLASMIPNYVVLYLVSFNILKLTYSKDLIIIDFIIFITKVWIGDLNIREQE
jgi:hypothetical protein